MCDNTQQGSFPMMAGSLSKRSFGICEKKEMLRIFALHVIVLLSPLIKSVHLLVEARS